MNLRNPLGLSVWVILVALLCSFSIEPARAESPHIVVGSAHTKKSVIAFPEFKDLGGATGMAKGIHEVVLNDLTFMDLFQFLSSAAFLEDANKTGINLDSFKMSNWSSIGAEFLVKTQLSSEKGSYRLSARVYDTTGVKLILGKDYLLGSTDSKAAGHIMANDIVTALTGLPGIFRTKIAMTCQKAGKKEIYMMNFDGTEVKQVTHHSSISFSPAWGPDGTKLAYSVFTRHKNNVKNIDLYEFDFNNNTVRLLSNHKGMNSGAAYSPDGKSLAVTMSFLGNPDIFLLDPKVSTVTRLTKSFGTDVDPTWSPDGKSIAFVSSRSGMPMVYSMNVDGSHIQRLTFAGRYNATPSWSPMGKKIAFAGYLEGKFDVFIMNPDGTNIERLTKNQGNNEDPTFSPDGNFIAFSSNRTGQENVYVMNVDGTFVKRLTYGLGRCVAPKWSNIPR